MPAKISMSDILALSADERIQLVEDIWDSLASHPESAGLTDAQRQELDTRLEACKKDPTGGSPWEVVKARIN